MTTLVFRSRSTLLMATLITATFAADSGLNAAQSSVIATFKQENVPVDAPFRRFSGSIKYDAANPAAASASIAVDMASLDIGEEEYNAEVRKPNWFDSTRFPQATFRSTSIKAGVGGHLEATGVLSIKGNATTITVPITYRPTGAIGSFEGGFDVSRKALGIGEPSWADVLDDTVHVRFHLVTAGN